MSDAQPIRYEPQEPAPHLLAAGLAAQIVTLMATGVMVSPLVVARGAGLDEAATSWLVFAALFAAGLSTWLQAMQLGRVGGGHTPDACNTIKDDLGAITATRGGAILNDGGTLRLTHVTMRNNRTIDISQSTVVGGGAVVNRGRATLVATDCLFVTL